MSNSNSDCNNSSSMRYITIFKYSVSRVLSSRRWIAFLVISWMFPLLTMSFVYIRKKSKVLKSFNIKLEDLIPIDSDFFLEVIHNPQTYLCYIACVFIGPRLISEDLKNNGLVLYLTRMNAWQYYLNKLCVLLVFLLVISLIPALLIFVFQFSIAGMDWYIKHNHIIWAIIIGHSFWIIFLSTMTLLFSAWSRNKIFAGLLIFAVPIMMTPFAYLIERITKWEWVWVLNVNVLNEDILKQLYFGSSQEIIFSEAMIVLCLYVIIFVVLTFKKIKAVEVVS